MLDSPERIGKVPSTCACGSPEAVSEEAKGMDDANDPPGGTKTKTEGITERTGILDQQ